MDKRIWTIGHSVHSLDMFIGLLIEHDVQMLADVRAFAASRRVPQFNQEALAEALAGQGIGYIHLPALGGRRRPKDDSPHTAWRNASFRGYADHMDSAMFAQALHALQEIALAHRTCMMCAEVLWWRCHRSLIADRLKVDGWTVLHIMPQRTEEHPLTTAARVVAGRLSYGESP